MATAYTDKYGHFKENKHGISKALDQPVQCFQATST